MPSQLYDGGWNQINGRSGTWTSSTYKALLLTSSYVFDQTHAHISDVVAAELAAPGYARFNPITGKSFAAGGPFDSYVADDFDFGTPDASYFWQYLVIARFVTSDALSPLVGQVTLPTPIPTDGMALILTAPADGWIIEASA